MRIASPTYAGAFLITTSLFLALAHNAASPAEYFHLPEPRTVVMGSQVDI